MTGVYDISLVGEADNLVGATLVVARADRPEAPFVQTGRHKGVPYELVSWCCVSA